SDVNGIYLDAKDETTKLSRISAREAEEMILSGKATGGMIPKLQSLINILNRGVKSAHIIGGSVRNALLSEVFTDKGTGTMLAGE
ncbi:MAG: acetylglutamate kinase, partial [Pyrinomonadaceae bacterium]